tara:strand:+ start:178 stop:1206 length:1029 start_codon:yes stop_codon:yes gene_type:complete
MKKIAVTGGSGFFGSYLLEYLISKDLECLSIDIRDPDIKKNEYAFKKIDVCNQLELTKNLNNIDALFHCVAQVPLAKNKTLFNKINILGTRSVLDASLSKGIKKVIIISSSAVYGIPQVNPVSENSVAYPLEDYGKTKLAAEKICFEKKYKNLDITIIRPRTIMGHGRLGIFEILFEWISEGKNIPVLNGGKNVYQFIHAKDLAKACLIASKLEGINVINCGTNDYSSMHDLLNSLCKYANTGSKLKSLPLSLVEPLMNILSFFKLSPLAPYHALMYGRSLYFDNKKLKSLGWSSDYSNDRMFRESYEWYLKNKEKIEFEQNKSAHKSKVKQKILKLVKYFL